MKIHLKMIVVVGLIALLVPILLGYVAITGASHRNLIREHEFSKNYTNDTCTAAGCHTTLTKNESKDVQNLAAHRRHFLTVFLNFAKNYVTGAPPSATSYGCGKCHGRTPYGGGVGAGLGSGYEGDVSYSWDSSETTAADPNSTPTVSSYMGNVARKLVNPQFCRTCHGDFKAGSGGASGHNNTDLAVTDPRGCLLGSCHNGSGGTGDSPQTAHGSGPIGSTTQTPSPWAGAWWIDQRYANAKDFCARCHGELQWYQVEETNPTQ